MSEAATAEERRPAFETLAAAIHLATAHACRHPGHAPGRLALQAPGFVDARSVNPAQGASEALGRHLDDGPRQAGA